MARNRKEPERINVISVGTGGKGNASYPPPEIPLLAHLWVQLGSGTKISRDGKGRAPELEKGARPGYTLL